MSIGDAACRISFLLLLLFSLRALPLHTQNFRKKVYIVPMGRTNIEIDDSLIRQARKLTRLKTKRQIVDRALDLLVRSESRKGILKYYGSGIWQGDLKQSRRNRG
jgi:Arc/MetJ family transcription regulator